MNLELEFEDEIEQIRLALLGEVDKRIIADQVQPSWA